MDGLVRWWKDKTFLMILCIIAITMAVAFLLAYFIEWGWPIAIALALGGGFAIRKVVIKKLDDIADK